MSTALEEEREILESIYPDELQLVNERTFRITQTILPEESHLEEEVSVIFTATCGDEYPEVVPEFTIEYEPSSVLEDTDKDRVVALVKQNAEENIGMAMLFSLCSILKEEVIAMLEEKHQAEERRIEAEKQRQLAAENKKFQGTPVTRETFLAWKEKFDVWRKEQERLQQEKQLSDALSAASSAAARKAILETKMTGRELFENNLVKLDDGEEPDEVDAAA
ncbi:RWD domain-containing protein [Schizosaccharomyces japonicus yFS275]|uniref:RWD domain-containing protein n=1 Tax=Schizosaccharomyces japonicus (strain yFS275 / FY16936) TaxID=402676 RepID=B6K6C0_SCHJY|nr:RWD domain-containing protein [Schizosaccharomyces japonicus yFS275]EEB09074.1 RWD domain-containing protein [Schizosaccharomyces japonicus yFS275]